MVDYRQLRAAESIDETVELVEVDGKYGIRHCWLDSDRNRHVELNMDFTRKIAESKFEGFLMDGYWEIKPPLLLLSDGTVKSFGLEDVA